MVKSILTNDQTKYETIAQKNYMFPEINNGKYQIAHAVFLTRV